MKIFNGFPTGQTPAESNSLNGCLSDIETYALGNHGIITRLSHSKQWPLGPARKLVILQG
jgi:hypothetical protein